MMLDRARPTPSSHLFGTLPDGTEVRELRLRGESLHVAVLTFGAVIRELSFREQEVTLGFDTLEPYTHANSYVGAIAGRYANRIAGGRFLLDGTDHRLSLNEGGTTHLHGGRRGFSHRNWTILDHDPTSVALELISPDGDEGYPGALTARCTYRIVEPDTLRIELDARTDRTTVVNLAAHSYFNLDGAPTIVDHLLTICAEAYLPVTADKIPTGRIAPVAGTQFDFLSARRIGPGACDHNFVVAMHAAAEPRSMARLIGPRSGISMDILSTEPGLQFYDGHMLDADRLERDGAPVGRHAGLCLEPQRFPNAPNEPDFPDAILKPGETYRQVTEYRFSQASAADREDAA